MTGQDTKEAATTKSEANPPETSTTAGQQPSGSPLRICYAFNAMYFGTASAQEAQVYAQQSGRRVYSWMAVGHASWLEVGVSHRYVLGLLALPPGLPDSIDLEEDASIAPAKEEEVYPVLSALIEGLLLDVNACLCWLGFAYRLPTFFRRGAVFARHRKLPEIGPMSSSIEGR